MTLQSEADTSPTISDEVGLVRAAQRDRAEFATLYRLYLPRVYRYVRARVRDDEPAADLTQQIFLKALQALPGYRERGLPFAAWLFRIASNQIVDAIRRQKLVTTVDLLPEIASADSRLDPEESAIRRESSDRLRRLIGKLPPDERELLALRFAASLSSREIAAMVGKSEDAVKKRFSRLLHSLRDQIGDEYRGV